MKFQRKSCSDGFSGYFFGGKFVFLFECKELPGKSWDPDSSLASMRMTQRGCLTPCAFKALMAMIELWNSN